MEVSIKPQNADSRMQSVTSARSLGIWLGFVVLKQSRSRPQEKRKHTGRMHMIRVATATSTTYSEYAAARSHTLFMSPLMTHPYGWKSTRGAAVSLISKATYDSLWDTPPTLVPTKTRLRTYSGQPLVVLGTLEATIKYEAQQVVHSILVVEGAGPNLLGRDLLSVLKLDWSALAVQYTGRHPPLTEVLKKHDDVFHSELGKAKHITATLHLEDGATPKFCNARPVPYAIREKIERELERLKRDDIIEPTQFSDWAAPVVPVTKADGSLRLCGDYKLTINKAAKLDSYPLPKIEDLFAKLAGGKRFTKLDVAHAYQQIPLSEESKPYVTINTHKGLFRYNRLPLGVHSAPAIFQRAMESLLRDVPSTVVYLDDILISGKDEQEHLRNVDTVLERLEKEGPTLKRTKCHFMLDRIEYLGHTISAEGLQPAAGKTKAIWEAPVSHSSGPDYNKLWKIQPIITTETSAFMYKPHRQLSVDESMIGMKCHLSFIQYRKAKPVKGS